MMTFDEHRDMTTDPDIEIETVMMTFDEHRDMTTDPMRNIGYAIC